MTDRPIIFSGPMVRALLEGRKTQTRRLATSPLSKAVVGDRLWVRESFMIASDDYGWDDYHIRQGCSPDLTAFAAVDGSDLGMPPAGYAPPSNAKRELQGPVDAEETWTQIGRIPSLYMPRWASRLTLVVSGVLIEPLQQISRVDCVAEGHPRSDDPFPEEVHLDAARDWYKDLWDSLHPKEPWSSNPLVVALEFEVERTWPAKA